jgi:hypothetical protein
MSGQLNVYGFGVQLKSDIAAGNHGGRNVAVIAADPQSARAYLVSTLTGVGKGDELQKISGGGLVLAGALYSGGAGVTVPACTTAPYVSGMGAVGGVLNCTMGNWTGTPTSYAYQWKSDGVTDLGTGPSYTVQPTDSTHSITCVVTATNAAGSTAAPPSNAFRIA